MFLSWNLWNRMTIEFVSYFTGAVELGGGGEGEGQKYVFAPPPHFFVEEIYISGQIKQKTLFCSIQKCSKSLPPPPPPPPHTFKRNKKVCPHFVVCSYATASVTWMVCGPYIYTCNYKILRWLYWYMCLMIINDVMAEMQRLFHKTNSNCKRRSRP